MAIPAQPSGFYVSQANMQVYLIWNLTAGALSYSIQRSVDGVNYSTIANPTLNNYLDTTVSAGTQYYYQIASTNASGTSGYTTPQSVIPSPTAELSLMELRLRAKERADRVAANFVIPTEWNFFINQAMYELYDLLITTYEDYFLAPPAIFQIVGNQNTYPLPNGVISFLTPNTNTPFVAAPLYKLRGVDLALNTSQNAYVTVNQFNFIDRNNYVYPNSNSTIYGVFNLKYRMMGTNIQFIPTPTAFQIIQLWYIPRLPELLQETDMTTLGFSGWLQYVIIRAAKYALDKEESDTSTLTEELLFLKKRIEESAQSRDTGAPQTISNVRKNGNWGGDNDFNGFQGGY